MDKKTEVKTFLTRKYCDKCGGEMLPNGGCLSTYPPKFSHTCNKCGNIEAFWDKYPKIEYEDK